MAWRFVRQPDGRLARFSDVCDDFTHYDLTREEALRVCAENDLGPRSAEEKVRAGEEDHEPWKHNRPGHGLSRWEDCLRTIGGRHGLPHLRSTLAEIGFPDYDFSALGIRPWHEGDGGAAADGAGVRAADCP